MFLAIEFCLTVIFLSLSSVCAHVGDKWMAKMEQHVAAFARHRVPAVIAVGILALGIRSALLPVLPIPEPAVTDEYSYLLLADTLAHGRLANPTHPMWMHFETFHVNWHPFYASMYYPGFAVFLAIGQVVLGHPFWGVWLSSGLMCASICWALQGWISPGWALLGGLLAVIRLGTFSYWADSYWGGTVTALGGALVLGALPRIKSHQRIRDSVLMALGMALLASTRPYEGLFFCIPVIFALLQWTRRTSMSWRATLLRVAFPAGLVTFVALVFLSYYFWRVTGSPFTTPYQINIRSYGLVYFPWQKITEVQGFHHAVMRMFYRGDAVLGVYNFARQHPFRLQLSKILVSWLFYFGPAITVPWVLWFFTRPRGRFWQSFSSELRFLLLVLIVTWISLALTIYVGQPHYSSPLTIVFYGMTLLMMRDVYNWQPRSEPAGRFLARSVVIVCAALFLFRAAAPALHISPVSWIRTWCSEDEQNLERARILKQLQSTPGQHLVIVRYQPKHDYILNEWVFNNADIDASKVVWARDMGEQNTELLHYFRERKTWLVEPDYDPPRLSPYVAE